MASVDDVAAAIVEKTGPLDTFKLQKLVYYCQAWHLVWDEEPLFDDQIEAWAGGPVVRALYDTHRGRYRVTEWPQGKPGRLSTSEAATVAVVVRAYSHLSGRQLSTLTHREAPWLRARQGLGPAERGSRPIDIDDMREYYRAMDQDAEATPVEDLPSPADDDEPF